MAVSGTIARGSSRRLIEWEHIHADSETMSCTADKNTGDWRHVAVVSAPRQEDVVGKTHLVICGVEFQPLAVPDVD